MQAEKYVLVRRDFAPTDRRLGRHVVHDSRSLRYLAPRQDPATLKSIRHQIILPNNVLALDQGNEGSCTGHAGFANLSSGAFYTSNPILSRVPDGHEYAVDLYSEATKLDPWPGEFRPDDTGSDGLSIAKVLKARDMISGYQHATSVEAVLTALSKQVVMIGSSWMSDMYGPTGEGQIKFSGYNEGGHEYVLDELDVERKRAWMRNSWGTGWGKQGRAWLSWDDLAKLMADDGDCTVLVPRTEPAPVPAPVEPAAPGASAAEKSLAEALQRLLDNRSAPAYMKKPAAAWLAEKNFK